MILIVKTIFLSILAMVSLFVTCLVFNIDYGIILLMNLYQPIQIFVEQTEYGFIERFIMVTSTSVLLLSANEHYVELCSNMEKKIWR